jgi:hypothetical protein
MKRNSQSGVALLSAILVLMLMSALLVGFVAMVNADQMSSGINRDQTQAYAAAHAGVEKLTSDLGRLFETNFAPTRAQIDALWTNPMQPVLPGMTFVRPNGSSGYRITFLDANADNIPDLEVATGSMITAGPYEGLVGLITPYTIEVTARTTGGAESRMRRTVQTVAIPVFQFGIFSENNQSFFAGPDFAFGGRVHTNQHLFLKQDGTATLTLQDRVTAVGEVIRSHLSNGVTGSHASPNIRVARAAGCPAAPAAINASCRNLADTEGSQITNLGSGNNEPTWTNISTGNYNSWIRNGRTGARRLDLPIVSDGAAPIDLIKRPLVGEDPLSDIGRQRFYNMGTLRILISDRPENLTGLPGVQWTAAGVNTSPIRLAGALTVSAAEVAAAPAAPNNILPAGVHPFAVTPAMLTNNDIRDRLRDGYRTTAGTALVDGWILINRQNRAGVWTDVTKEVLNYGFAGRRLSDGNLDVVDLNNACIDAHPNAIIRVQRYRDTVANANCVAAAPLMTGDQYWPNVLYDAREGMLRDDENNRPVAGTPSNVTNVVDAQRRLYWGGVMHYVELDVNNLRRWLRGDLGGSNSNACLNGAGPNTCAMDTTGFVVYFSDRRTNRNFGANAAADPAAFDATGPVYVDDVETGEFGMEDIINPANANSQPNNAMDGAFVDAQGVNRWAEDINQNGAVVALPETYGSSARLLPVVPALLWPTAPYLPNQMLRLWAADAGMTPVGVPSTATYTLFGTPGVYGLPIDRNVARVNRAFFYRRGLKLVNGGRGNLPANGSQGLTVAAENPVYIQGNYNACTNAIPSNANPTPFSPACTGGIGFGTVPAVDHVSAAVIADSVTFLSNAWNDIRSFVNPHEADLGPDTAAGVTNRADGVHYDVRQAITTWYRLGIIGGKGLSFTRPTNNARDHQDFGTDGGAHNFIRFLENWGGGTLNYRGSLISFYTSRQGVGIYKCCNVVYTAPNRGYNFEAEFLNPALLPPRTPMFRDINTLTFRQILRPTQ